MLFRSRSLIFIFDESLELPGGFGSEGLIVLSAFSAKHVFCTE